MSWLMACRCVRHQDLL